jgi:hypothetical protein
LAQSSFAQEKPKPEPTVVDCPSLDNLPSACQASFTAWRAGEKKWRDWVERYGNRIVMDASGYSMRQRPKRPEIPEWMTALCAPSIKDRFPDGPVCALMDDSLRYDWVQHYAGPPPPPVHTHNKGVGENADIWTWLLQSMHYDVGWVPASTSGRFLLIGGVHLSIAEISNRVSVFAPGVMIVRLPIGGGRHSYRPAQTWGLSVRLKDFQFPWSGKGYSLYFNLANCRIAGMEMPSDSVTGSSSSVSVMGFSFSPKK